MVEVSDNIREFLKLSLKYRVFPKVGKTDFKVEAEARSAKERWTLSDVKSHPGESFDQRTARLEQDNWDREPFQRGGKSADFSKVRVTSLLYNKMVQMPPPGDWADEVTIQQQQLERPSTEP